ncbi:MAG: type II secretion system protein GspG [Phycisphaerales bacterium]
MANLQRTRLDRISCAVCALIATTVWTVLFPVHPASAAAVAAGDASDTGRFLRVHESEGSSIIALEVAIRRYTPSDGIGPEVALVGVAHIGDAALYDALQKSLDSFDRVLYESVKPAGAARPGGDTDSERIESTRASLHFLANAAATIKERTGELPADLDQLAASIAEVDPRVAQWIELARIDAWGAEVVYTLNPQGDGVLVHSLGADALPGGSDVNADIHAEEQSQALALSSEDGLQAELAKALDLEFQLNAIDYDRANWVCSDMSADQVQRALEARGLDFDVLGGTLAGSSIPAQAIKLMLRLMRAADAMMDGAVSDLMKVMLIEMLGDESITTRAIEQQMGAGFADVIVGERNAVVMTDLARIRADEPDVKSVAIFYGAAHMSDFEERLKQIGYVDAGAEWIKAIEVDMAKSAMGEREMNQMRNMVRRSLRQMMNR